ncbi:hypothetical protein FRC04_001589 [Tulasnella sp. 424]|nr:hypothetical protein FRC04_001589 [Tulasnella sp. 424]
MFARPERDAPAVDPLECRKQAISAEALSPATAATIKWLASEQTNYPMSIGRVVATVGCTISVYHPVFSQFQTHMENAELIPTPDQARKAHKLLDIGQTVYATEDDRLAELYPILSHLLYPVEGPPSYLGFEPDGLIFVRTQNDAIPILVLETKNEIGTGGCDPEVQCAFSYQKLWSHDTRLSKVRNACCCPSFLLSMAGHKFTIHGAVLAEGFITEPLTEGIGMAGFSNKSARAEKVAKYFAALQKCLQTLSDYYMTLKPRDDCELASFSPEFRKYGENSQFNLTYTSANLLPGRNGRAMFNALLKGPGISGRVAVKVKFTTRYCPEAHELLAKKGLAPKLLHWESFSGKWKVVVMDSLPGDNMATMPQQPIPKRALKDLEDALTLLHSKDWVYGDLRRPNIITCTRDGAVEPGAMLVDFDWAGKHGKQTYPLGLSEHVKWPNGVRGGERMKKEHDIAMFDMLCMNKM